MSKALIFGSTGLTGSALLELLLRNDQYSELVCFVRKESSSAHNKLRYIKTDFSDLDKHANEFEKTDVYCCLGTTIKKVNYDKEKFKEADLYTPLKIAECVKKYHANQFLIISALGANSKSRIFYNRVKGELQEKLLSLHISSLHIFQPSLLLGDRKEKRIGEEIGAVFSKLISPLLTGRSKKYRPIKVTAIAKAMAKVAGENKQGEYIYTSDLIQKMADA